MSNIRSTDCTCNFFANKLYLCRCWE